MKTLWRKEARDVYIPQVACSRCSKREDIPLGEDARVFLAGGDRELPAGAILLSSKYGCESPPSTWGSVHLAQGSNYITGTGGLLCGDCLAGLTTALSKIMKGAK